MNRLSIRYIDLIGIAIILVLAGLVLGVYTAFWAGNRVIDLNVKTHEHERALMIEQWRRACVWWYPGKRIEGAPILCYAPEFLVE